MIPAQPCAFTRSQRSHAIPYLLPCPRPRNTAVAVVGKRGAARSLGTKLGCTCRLVRETPALALCVASQRQLRNCQLATCHFLRVPFSFSSFPSPKPPSHDNRDRQPRPRPLQPRGTQQSRPLVLTTGQQRPASMATPMSSPAHKPRRRVKKTTRFDDNIARKPETLVRTPSFPLAALLWPARSSHSQWEVLPLVLMVVGLFRWSAGLWGYSGT